MHAESPNRKTQTEQGCLKQSAPFCHLLWEKKKSICFFHRSYNTGQATFAPPCPDCQSASRSEFMPPTYATKQIIPGNSATHYLLLSTHSAWGHCVFSVQRSKRQAQRAVCIHRMQPNLWKCFTLLSLTDSALNNRLLSQSILLNKVAEVGGTECWRSYWEP